MKTRFINKGLPNLFPKMMLNHLTKQIVLFSGECEGTVIHDPRPSGNSFSTHKDNWNMDDFIDVPEQSIIEIQNR